MTTPGPSEREPGVAASRSEVDVREELMIDGGRRYEISGLAGPRVSVIITPGGERDVVLLTEVDDDPVLTRTFTHAQARALGSVLAGTFNRGARRA